MSCAVLCLVSCAVMISQSVSNQRLPVRQKIVRDTARNIQAGEHVTNGCLSRHDGCDMHAYLLRRGRTLSSISYSFEKETNVKERELESSRVFFRSLESECLH